MRIKEITHDYIEFDNGFKITYDHNQDCYEDNYADFEQLDDIAKNMEFDEEIIFESINLSGFRFGNPDGRMFFVPCYSEQNGAYTDKLDIYFNDKKVLTFHCEFRAIS